MEYAKLQTAGDRAHGCAPSEDTQGKCDKDKISTWDEGDPGHDELSLPTDVFPV